jgi:hypothetical protein
MTSGEVSSPLSIICSSVYFQNKIALKVIILDAIIPSIKYFFQCAWLYDSQNSYVCMYFFYWLSMLHYNWVILHAISHIVTYHGVVLRFTHFASPLGYMVFVIN